MRILLSVLFSSIVLIGSEMEWKAEFRARVERDTVSAPNDTASTHGQSSLTHFRSRLILRMSQGSLSGAVQFQDVRILGAPENASGKTGQDQNTIAFSQAYIQYRIKNNGRMRIGRFDLPLGNERLFSRNQWSLHGRFFEGFLAEYEFGQLAVTKVFRVYLEENYANFSSDGDDTIIDGFYVTSKNPFTRMNSISGLELYGFRELNIGNTADAIQRNTYGGRLTGNLNLLVVGFALEFEGAIQSGFAPGFNSIEGNMSVLNFIFDIPMLFNSQITIGLENYSGDNSATEDIGEGFANPYGAGHKWHGYMDYHKMFPTNGEMGLNETSLRFQVPIFDTYRLAIHTHDFQSGNGSVEFGSEIDIVFTINAGPRLSFSQGYSRYTHKNGSWKTGTDEFAYFSISAVL